MRAPLLIALATFTLLGCGSDSSSDHPADCEPEAEYGICTAQLCCYKPDAHCYWVINGEEMFECDHAVSGDACYDIWGQGQLYLVEYCSPEP
ncbi:MAG: hypothetical protein AB1640_07260 [bacterium]